MGISMHGYIELQIMEGLWEGIINLEFLPPYIHYMDKIAGIRGETTPSNYNKGIPLNMSEECELSLKKDQEDYGEWLHDIVWLDGSELEWVLKDVEDKNEPWTKDFFVLKKMFAILCVVYGEENIRGIFWFDN